MGGRSGQRGFGLIEILLVLVVVAVGGVLVYRYFASTMQSLEQVQEQRPLAQARLAADQTTLNAIQGLLRTYQAQHGRWPPDKAAVLGLLAGAPRFQCPGNDFEYDPATGALRLLITDPTAC